MDMSGLKCLVALLLLQYCFLHVLIVLSDDDPSANLSTVWINNPSIKKGSWSFSDGSTIRPVLLVDTGNINGFGFGFYSNGTRSLFILVVFYTTLGRNSSFIVDYPPQIVWSSNRDQPVRENATLEFTAQGDLALSDVDGQFVWSTNTSGLSVTTMNLTDLGNLQLLNGSHFGVVWQSFDHPTDAWLPNQTLYIGQRLTASVSTTDYSTGLYYLSVSDDGIYAFLDSDLPIMYRNLLVFSGSNAKEGFVIGYLRGVPTNVKYVPSVGDFGYVRLEPDGHLNVYRFTNLSEPKLISNLLKDDDRFGDCAYPTVCGNYGVCSDGQCSCTGDTNYFGQVNAMQPNRGCFEVTPLSCNDTHLHIFLELENVAYFDFVPLLSNTDVESCKKACLSNCSCKAALFRYQKNVSSGNCSLPLQLFTLMATRKEVVGYNSYAFIKVQRSSNEEKLLLGQKINFTPFIVKILVPCLSAFIVFVNGACHYYQVMRKKSSVETEGEGEEEDESLDNVSGMLTRFSFEDLRSAMQSVGRRLGGGGFGSVYEGVLENGTRVAVKILESVHQGRREFMAELNTIGSIHHVNLVRLIGYCTEGSNRLLVYEHMCNGSLDKWIFDQNRAQTLNWEVRRKIIVGIAEGLEYLHEHCNQNIIHFDIKPQNILLDENFNVKISDFGLAKLIDRNQSQVLTRMKGTPGYAAPELIGGRNVSVKADVYSFGIVILEIVCGRKNSDYSQEDYLIDMVKIKAEDDRLSDLIDDRNQDMQFHRGEAVKTMEIAIRCLQPQYRRPYVSMVLKVLEGVMDMEAISDYSFLTMVNIGNPSEATPAVSAPLLASILSGPR